MPLLRVIHHAEQCFIVPSNVPLVITRLINLGSWQCRALAILESPPEGQHVTTSRLVSLTATPHHIVANIPRAWSLKTHMNHTQTVAHTAVTAQHAATLPGSIQINQALCWASRCGALSQSHLQHTTHMPYQCQRSLHGTGCCTHCAMIGKP